MPRGRPRRRRNRRRQGTNSRRGGFNSHMSRPLVNVRPKNFRHTKVGHGSASFNTRRKLTAYPVNPDSKNWVLDGLAWAGRMVLSLLGVKSTTLISDLSELIPQHEMRCRFPMYSLSDTATIYNPMGAFTCWKIGPEDLLAEHPLATYKSSTTEKSYYNTIPFAEGMIEWISISVHPGVTVNAREGQIAMAIQPACIAAHDTDFVVSGFHQIMSMPKSVCGEASRPLTITWSPSAHDAGSMWRRIGSTNITANTTNRPIMPGYKTAFGGDPSLVWYFAYSAHGDGEAGSSHYSPSSGTFSIYMDGRVRLRTPTETPMKCRVEPWSTFKFGPYEATPRGLPKGLVSGTTILDPHGRRIVLVDTEQLAIQDLAI